MRGVYAHPKCGFNERLAAVCARIPDGVIAGAAAMAATRNLAEEPSVIDVCTPTHRMPQAGYRFVERRVAPEYVSRSVMSPILAAVDRAKDDADWIDDLVRDRLAQPKQFADALATCPGRKGNRARRRRVIRTFTNPWSAGERRFHDILDDAKITGWEANMRVQCGESKYDIDIAFHGLKLAIEFDGYKTHGTRAAFEKDRTKQNDLVQAGWVVLRFTWAMLADVQAVVGAIRKVINRLKRAAR